MAAAASISLRWKNNRNTTSRGTESDEKLVAAAKRGQTVAFDELFRRHAKNIYRTTYRITRNREDAEDAVQDCFLNVLVHLESFDGRARFLTWLTRVAMNAALMRLRKNRNGREIPLGQSAEWMEIPEPRLTDSSLNPEERYARSEQEGMLKSAVAELRPSIRKVVEVHQLQEHSLHETAEVLGISVAATKARMFHARAALRRSSRLRLAVPRSWTTAEMSSQARR